MMHNTDQQDVGRDSREVNNSVSIQPPSVGPGQRLARARNEAELSTEEVARYLNLDEQIILDIEMNKFTKPAVFVKGYLRSYAKMVGEPAEEIVAMYAALDIAPSMDKVKPATRPLEKLNEFNVSLNDSSMRWISYTVIAGLSLLVLTWWQTHKSSAPAIPAENTIQLTPTTDSTSNPGDTTTVQTNSPASEPGTLEGTAANPSGNTDSTSPVPADGAGSMTTPVVQEGAISSPASAGTQSSPPTLIAAPPQSTAPGTAVIHSDTQVKAITTTPTGEIKKVQPPIGVTGPSVSPSSGTIPTPQPSVPNAASPNSLPLTPGTSVTPAVPAASTTPVVTAPSATPAQSSSTPKSTVVKPRTTLKASGANSSKKPSSSNSAGGASKQMTNQPNSKPADKQPVNTQPQQENRRVWF